MLKKYHITSEGEDFYKLIFDENGCMYVEIFRDFEQPYKRPRATNVYPEQFDRFTVGNRTLKQLVVNELDAILPKLN